MPAVSPLPGPFGAVVSDANLRDGLHGSLTEHLQAALAEHRILVLDNQNLTDAEFANFSRIWGEPIEYFSARDRDNSVPEVIIISNTAKTPARLRDGAMHWHQDSSYESPPAAVTMLSAIEAPEGRNETLFADVTAAFEALPVEQQNELTKLQVVHDRRGCPAELLFPGERRGEGAPEAPLVTHPLVVTHPVSGRRSMYGIAGTPVGIVGMDNDKAFELLTGLKKHALSPKFRQAATAAVGSILVWDNLAVMHCATETEYSDEPGRRRLVRRISTKLASPLG